MSPTLTEWDDDVPVLTRQPAIRDLSAYLREHEHSHDRNAGILTPAPEPEPHFVFDISREETRLYDAGGFWVATFYGSIQ